MSSLPVLQFGKEAESLRTVRYCLSMQCLPVRIKESLANPLPHCGGFSFVPSDSNAASGGETARFRSVKTIMERLTWVLKTLLGVGWGYIAEQKSFGYYGGA